MFPKSGTNYPNRHIVTWLVVLACFSGCGKEKTTSSLPGAHPEKWIEQSSPDFHGNVALFNGLTGCTTCHGGDWAGGRVEVSCLDCHRASADMCISCHGGLDNGSGAPPRGLEGETSDTTLAVGAHTIHLEGSGLTSGVTCDVCHYTPLFLLDSLHLDLASACGGQSIDSVAELTWGELPGGESVWDRGTGSCSGTYCHGNFAGGQADNSPVWTSSDQASCGSCHDVGDDPASLGWEHEFHVTATGLRCADCHAGVLDTLLNLIGPDLHVNGAVDTLQRDAELCSPCHGPGPVSCVVCHGGVDNLLGSPPAGLEGEVSSTELAVGAHTAHVEDGVLADAFTCSQCHLTPGSILEPGHLGTDNVAELTWGELPGGESVWDRGTGSCSGTYCHGNFAGGQADNSPVWTSSDQASCGSCHDVGDDPASLGWEHEFHVTATGLRCADCHAGVLDTLLNLTGPDLHVNGAVDTLQRDAELCSPCHGPGPVSCVVCHGGVDNQLGSPPAGLEGEVSTDELAVGAHTVHVEEGLLADAFSCTECHLTPTTILEPGHLGTDNIAELSWGELPGGQSVWDRGTASCSGIYCHGNFPGGKIANAPVWTSSDQASCGSCHDVGDDPASLGWEHEFHVTTTGLRCADCHAGVIDTLLNLTGPDLHVNGAVDTLQRDPELCSACHGPGPVSCVVCHGGLDNQLGSPPAGLEGEVSTDELAVGAHTGHVEEGLLADAFSCTECHLTPSTVPEPGHLGTDNIAELTWGELSGEESVWDRSAESCSRTYCHGNFAGGRADNGPVWTSSDQAGCGSCHDVGDDPASLGWEHEFHVTTTGLRCADCHAGVIDTLLNLTGPDLHVNGAVDTLQRDAELCSACHGPGPVSCVVCHGGVDNQLGSPPAGLEGEVSTTELAVGAHTAHVEDGLTADAFTCSQCHLTPGSILEPGHLGTDNIAELSWGELAGGQSVWDRGTASCSGTYCHGNFAGGKAHNSPVWTSSDQAGCGSCHDVGDDPASLGWEHEFHVTTTGLRCADCHAGVIDTLLNVTAPDLHVNGAVDTLQRDPALCSPCHGPGPVSCVVCHGGLDNQLGSPPAGLEGEVSTTELAVGAHTAHVEDGLTADAFTCSQCHLTPTTIPEPGHLGTDNIAELSWGELAGGQSVWDRGTASCSGTYCHGNFAGGKAHNSPVWTSSDQAGCGSCHDVGDDPASLGWEHEFHVTTTGLRCADCHAGVIDTLLNVTAPDLHVNGAVDTLQRDPALCSPCHGPGPVSCVVCHGGLDNQLGSPPAGLEGEVSTTELAVGAHTAHVEDGLTADAFTCSQCHLTPTTILEPGHLGTDNIAELSWGELAGGQSVWDRSAESCSRTYCHGNFPGGKIANAPVWTSSDQAGCGSCHDVGDDPASLGGKHWKHVQIKDLLCSRCHSSTVDSTLNIIGTSVHLDGQNQVSFSTGQGSYDNWTCSSLENECHRPRSWYKGR